MSNSAVPSAPISPQISTPTHPAHLFAPGENVENLVLPDGAVGQETAELLQDLVHVQHTAQDTSEGPSDSPGNAVGNGGSPKVQRKNNARRLLMLLPLLSIPAAITMAPRIEIYNLLACSVHKPEIFDMQFGGTQWGALRGPPSNIFQSAANVAPKPAYHIQFPSKLANERRPKSIEDILPTSNESPQSKCASDPVVRTAVAKLTAVIAATSGILMCLTTGWWGSFSDRYGRKPVITLATCSMLITDLNFILATWFSKHIPGGYWFLLIGPIADGLFGGITVTIIINQSYIADSTVENERSAVFSFALGLLYSGMAIGPTIGSLLIHFTGNILSVFYLSAVFHILYAICVLALVPESLSLEQMEESRVKYAESLAGTAGTSNGSRTLSTRLFVKARSVFAFMAPLAIFLPVRETRNTNPGKRRRWDWSMTTMIIGYALMISVAGSYSYTFQYATSTFNWSAETLGYWLSFVGASRALHLAIVLPLVFKLFKPKPIHSDQAHANVQADPAPISDVDKDPSDSSVPLLGKAPQTKAHSSAFDLRVAKYSVFIELAAFAGMGLSTKSIFFATFGILGAFGVGFTPAAEATILALYLRRGDTETGKLFGAIGLVQAICSQIGGPALFGLVYMKTVATHPRTIFICTVSTTIASFLLVSLVRLPKENVDGRDVPDDVEEQDTSL